MDTPILVRFGVGLTFIIISVWALDQYNAKLANLYIGVLALGMSLVYADEIGAFFELIGSLNGES